MSKKALLVMDVQNSILKLLGSGAADYINKVKLAVEKAHTAEIQVIYVVVRFKKGFPEVSANNKTFSAIRQRAEDFEESLNSNSTDPVIDPIGDDLVVIKKRVSAFSGSDLEMILRAQEITELILCGVATSGVVLSTLRYAADSDYKIKVLSDCCYDGDDDVNRILMEKVFPRQADVITLDQWL